MESLLTAIGYTTVVVYMLTNAAIIVMNLYLIICFWRNVGSWLPNLYNKIKVKLNIYFVFIISLLIARLVVTFPIIIQYYHNADIMVPLLHMLILCLTEVLPVVLLMFSFVTFGSSTNDDLEATDKRISNFMSFASSTAKHNQTFGNMDEHLVPDQQRSDKAGDEDTLQVRFVDKSAKTTKPQLNWDSKSSSVVIEDFKEEDLISSSDNQSCIKPEEKLFEFKINLDNKSQTTAKTEGQQQLTNALHEMMKDMGISSPSYKFSALHNMNLDSSYCEQKADNLQGTQTNKIL